jgi:hypothetical protein
MHETQRVFRGLEVNGGWKDSPGISENLKRARERRDEALRLGARHNLLAVIAPCITPVAATSRQ